jgi:carbonic anhydrase
MTRLRSSDLLARNRAWSAHVLSRDPQFFSRLENQQAPRFLWIGCSDSRVPSTQITDVDPGEIFVHRNVANLAHPTDVNLMSVLEYAVDVLKVEEILVVGHYGCGGVKASLGRLPGIADFWLESLRDLRRDRAAELEGLSGTELENRLCELNVEAQVVALSHSGILVSAWERGQKISIHGWVYTLGDGIIRDLQVSRSGA